MKTKQLLILTSLLLFTVLTSCSMRVWEATTTHKQVMDTYRTRDQIVKQFGLPSTKKQEAEYEEWYFDYGTKTITDGQANSAGYGTTSAAAVGGKTNGGLLAALGGSSSANRTASNARVVQQELKTFVKFTLQGDKVILWDTKGVDFGKYEWIKRKRPLF